MSLQDLTGKIPFERNALNIWVIYDHPKDFPEEYVARLWQVKNGSSPEFTASVIRSKSVERLREIFVNTGLVRIDRYNIDDECILETWL
jgi:hypothetical protein